MTKIKVQSRKSHMQFYAITEGPNTARKDHCLQQNTIFIPKARAFYCFFLPEVRRGVLGNQNFEKTINDT